MVRPDILVVDEILSVGDYQFQENVISEWKICSVEEQHFYMYRMMSNL